MKKLFKKLLCMVLVMSMVLSLPTKTNAASNNTINLSIKYDGEYVVLKWNSIPLKKGEEYGVYGLITKYEEYTYDYDVFGYTTKTSIKFKPHTYENWKFRIAVLRGNDTVESNYVYAYYVPSKSNPKITVKKQSNDIKLSWTKKKAYGYRVYMKKSGGEWKRIKSTKSRSYTVKNLSKGAYYFMVRPYCVVKDKTVLGGVSSKSKKSNKIKVIIK